MDHEACSLIQHYNALHLMSGYNFEYIIIIILFVKLFCTAALWEKKVGCFAIVLSGVTLTCLMVLAGPDLITNNTSNSGNHGNLIYTTGFHEH